MLDEEYYLKAQDDFDKELEELLAKNQANLSKLHEDIKTVSKVSGEASINVRKIGTSAPTRKVLQNTSNRKINQENEVKADIQNTK